MTKSPEILTNGEIIDLNLHNNHTLFFCLQLMTVFKMVAWVISESCSVFQGIFHMYKSYTWWASQVALMIKNPPHNAGHKRHGFNSCFGKIPWRRAWQPIPVSRTEELGGLQSIRWQRVRHDWIAWCMLLNFCISPFNTYFITVWSQPRT